MKVVEFEGKTVEEAMEKALTDLNVESSEIITKSEELKGGLFKGTSIKLSVIKLEDIKIFIQEYLKELLNNMGIEVNFECKIRDEQINIKMYSDKNSILIGKNGQTLKALQTIIKQVVYNKIKLYPYILLDVENYKDSQKYHLERLAKNIAKEVAKTKIEASMENMNSYERRIVHNVLTNFKGITTSSQGEEPNRHIVIKPSE